MYIDIAGNDGPNLMLEDLNINQAIEFVDALGLEGLEDKINELMSGFGMTLDAVLNMMFEVLAAAFKVEVHRGQWENQSIDIDINALAQARFRDCFLSWAPYCPESIRRYIYGLVRGNA